MIELQKRIEEEAERQYPDFHPMVKNAFIKGANFALEMDKWVKVEDGLPYDGQDVYVIQEDVHQYCAQYISGEFIVFNTMPVQGVSHWTPSLTLPKLPQ